MQSKDGRLRAMVISASMAAMGLVLPIAFHAVGLGSKFLPMLLPLLLNGFLVPLPWAIATGALVPLLSAVTTGMPPLFPPVAFSMSLECAVLSGTAAAIYRGRPSTAPIPSLWSDDMQTCQHISAADYPGNGCFPTPSASAAARSASAWRWGRGLPT